jgi:25S rRNA (adenine2142-N1)-methyltransferase
MSALGFIEIRERWKKNGKMAYWLYRKVPSDQSKVVKAFQKKIVLREGNRNNFNILL